MNHDPKRPNDRPEEFLEADDPVERSVLSTEGIESALDEIGAEITSRSRPATSRWSLRRPITKPRAALLIGFATIGIGAAVAGGSRLGARTGVFQPTPQEIAKVAKANPEKAKRLQSYLDAGGPGEALDPSGAGFRAVALQISSDIPWPTGYEAWRDSLISDEIRLSRASGGSGDRSVESTGALRGWFAMSSFCAWVLDWRHADIVGEAATAAKAAQAISEAPSWKAVTDEDSHLDPAATGNAGGKSRYSLFGWMLPFRDAVLAGDRAQVEHLLVTEDQGGRCQDYDWDWRAFISAHPEWRGLSESELRQKYRQHLASRRS
jgi:hypothetical protein